MRWEQVFHHVVPFILIVHLTCGVTKSRGKGKYRELLPVQLWSRDKLRCLRCLVLDHSELTMTQTRYPNNVCQACQSLFDGYWQRRDQKRRSQLSKYKKIDESGQKIKLRHHNVPALEQSAGDGCSMCVLILRELERWNSNEELRRLQKPEYPGARVSIFGPNRDQDQAPRTKETEVYARFLYKIGTSAHKIWCFMELRLASMNQGISRTFHRQWKLILLEKWYTNYPRTCSGQRKTFLPPVAG